MLRSTRLRDEISDRFPVVRCWSYDDVQVTPLQLAKEDALSFAANSQLTNLKLEADYAEQNDRHHVLVPVERYYRQKREKALTSDTLFASVTTA